MNQNNNLSKLSAPVVIQSLLVAFFADMKSINWTLAAGGFVGEGMMGILYPIVILFIVLVAMSQKDNVMKNLNFWSIAIVLYLLAFWLITNYFVGKPRVSLPMFFVFVIVAFAIPQFARVDARIMIKGMMFFPFFAIFRLDNVFYGVTNWNDTISMDASYGFLVPVSAAFAYMLFFFRKEDKWQKYITIALAVINGVFFIYLIQFGSRGPILSILMLLLFFWVVKKRKGTGVEVNRGKMVVCILGIIMVSTLFMPILKTLSSFFSSNNIYINAIGKMISLGEEENLLNGRESLFNIAWEGFLNNPIVGNGLDRFDANTNMLYPHNFIVQILYDGGFFLFFVLLIPFTMHYIKLMKRCNNDEFILISLLFMSSVPGALFSQDFWTISVLWLFFGSIMSKSFVMYNTTTPK